MPQFGASLRSSIALPESSIMLLIFLKYRLTVNESSLCIGDDVASSILYSVS